MQQPFDSLTGVVNSLIVDPLAGLAKVHTFVYEHPVPGLVLDVGWAAMSGGWRPCGGAANRCKP